MTASEGDDVGALRRLGEASDLIVDGVERELPGWVQRQVAFILDAWGRLDARRAIGGGPRRARSRRRTRRPGS